jgi:hypothetical protein
MFSMDPVLGFPVVPLNLFLRIIFPGQLGTFQAFQAFGQLVGGVFGPPLFASAVWSGLVADRLRLHLISRAEIFILRRWSLGRCP